MACVPRFMIERDFGRVSDEEMLEAAVRSDQVALERFPDVIWEHSHICALSDGTVTSYCIYSAPNEDRVREHAEAFGGHVVTRIHRIVDDVTPEEVRRRAAS
jgi:hypothetical protein